MELLDTFMTLPEKDRQHYVRLKKGYEGELMFDALTKKLQCECYILNDLLLNVNNTTFQIDSLLIVSEKICLFEVKNFEGDYFYETDTDVDRLYKRPNKEYTNPLHQLNRCKSLLRQLLHQIGFILPIEAQVVFINPGFTLYQATLDKPFIFPTQVNSYLKKIDGLPSRLNEKHKFLADKLISLHMEENPYTTLPPYHYEGLRKGLTCVGCRSFSMSVHGKKCVCGDCGHEELATTAVLRSVNELKLLFPKMRITTNLVYEWCRVVKCKKTIRRVLERNFKKAGVRQWTYYV
ncbi:nuclease-related domain-containing protein [Neobacillus sp. MM2021_6]|uniref:nuclease-related domain-containing protein n=1 Tax=Neobacillus sp. MM2021_6 TaxID=2817026 RepID=UPI00325B7D92